MPRYRTAYPPEFRRQMVDLVDPDARPKNHGDRQKELQQKAGPRRGC